MQVARIFVPTVVGLALFCSFIFHVTERERQRAMKREKKEIDFNLGGVYFNSGGVYFLGLVDFKWVCHIIS